MVPILLSLFPSMLSLFPILLSLVPSLLSLVNFEKLKGKEGDKKY